MKNHVKVYRHHDEAPNYDRLGETYGSAATYNVLDDWAPNWRSEGFPGLMRAALDTDGKGAIVGWLVGTTLSFRNAGAFCAVVNGARPIGYNDNAVEVAECGACIDEISAPWTSEENYSLYRISDGRTSTIEELQARLGILR